jgi:hypothetical protein
MHHIRLKHLLDFYHLGPYMQNKMVLDYMSFFNSIQDSQTFFKLVTEDYRQF